MIARIDLGSIQVDVSNKITSERLLARHILKQSNIICLKDSNKNWGETMKYGTITNVGIAVVLSSQSVWAGDITDTYNAGEPLTNTHLDNIKAAVNDNNATKQSRVNGTCAVGQAIRVINDDGTVICEVDSNSGGDITSVDTLSGSGLTGGASSGDVNLKIAGGFGACK